MLLHAQKLQIQPSGYKIRIFTTHHIIYHHINQDVRSGTPRSLILPHISVIMMAPFLLPKINPSTTVTGGDVQ